MAQADKRSVAEEHFDLPAGAFPFASRFMAVGKARLHYIREGRGPTLVFVHGNPTWSFMYRGIIRALRWTSPVLVCHGPRLVMDSRQKSMPALSRNF